MFLYQLIRPLLFSLPAETAHNLAFSLAKDLQRMPGLLEILSKRYTYNSPLLTQDLLGTTFQNPVGLAAGFDKNALLVDFITSLGFGFMEVGSVTNLSSSGNPKPRLFRLPKDKALLNRMGLGNCGPSAFLKNLKSHQKLFPLGINVAKSNQASLIAEEAVADMTNCFDILQDVADFLILNVSCPNTEDGKTFEEPESLEGLLRNIHNRRSQNTTLLLKVSSDLSASQLTQILEISERYDIDGFVIANTSVSREDLQTSQAVLDRYGRGGISGLPLRDKVLSLIKVAFNHFEGSKVIIGVGGIDSADVAYEYILAGASLLELYTGMIYKGPSIAYRVNRGIAKRLLKDGLPNIQSAVGKKAHE